MQSSNNCNPSLKLACIINSKCKKCKCKIINIFTKWVLFAPMHVYILY